MSKHIVFDSNKSTYSKSNLEPLVNRWMLQILVELNGNKEFIREDDFSQDEIAYALGLGKWINIESENFNKAEILSALNEKYKKSFRKKNVTFLNPYIYQNLKYIQSLIGLSDVEIKIVLFTSYICSYSLLEHTADCLGDVSTLDMYRVLSALLAEPEHLILDAFNGESQMVKSGLVTLCDGEQSLDRKFDSLSGSFVDALFSKEITTEDILDGLAFKSATSELSLSNYSHIDKELSLLAPYIKKSVKDGRKSVNVYIHGAPGTGKSQLIKAIADELNLSLFEVSSESSYGSLMDGEARLKALMACQSFLNEEKALIMLDEAEDIFNDSSLFEKSTAGKNKAWLNKFLEGNTIPTFWLSNTIAEIDPAFLRRFDFVFELKVPKKAQREEIINSACSHIISQEVIKEIASSEKISPAVINRASSIVSSLKDQLNETERDNTLKMILSNSLEAQGHGKFKVQKNALSDLYNPNFIKADCDLKNVTSGLIKQGEGRLCLFGPPGTGKTAYGHYLAKQMDKPLVLKKASDLISMWVGGTEKNIALSFEQAKDENAILMLDEVDSFLRDRRNANQQWEVTQVNEMLTQMESFNGIFIASTNLMGNLDQASIRRFDLKVKFDYLETQQVKELFTVYCESFGIAVNAHEIDFSMLTSLTPGDFALLARQHKFRPFSNSIAVKEALQAEAALKENNTQNKIGFV